MLTFASAIFALGCASDPQTIIIVTGDGGSSTATSGVASGSGGSGGIGGASTSSTASQGGSGGAGGDLVGGGSSVGGSGGQGGGVEPVCPAPACAQGANVINCDPACGALHAGCAATCDEPGTQLLHTLGFGTWTVQVPPVAEQHPGCAQHCEADEAWWAIRFLIPQTSQCVTMEAAPEDGLMLAGCSLDPIGISTVCPTGGGQACVQADYPACSQGQTAGMLLAIKSPVGQNPDGGAIFRFTIVDQVCAMQPMCDLGCNGEG